MMNNRAKGMWWSRLVAGLLCLCIVVSGVGVSIEKARAEEAPSTHVIVEHWHTDGTRESEDKTLTSEEKPWEVQPAPYDGEKFTAFSLTAGQTAAKIEDNIVRVSYDPLVHLVKIHVFYSSDEKVLGRDFGAAFEDYMEDPQKDTLTQQEYKELKEKDTSGGEDLRFLMRTIKSITLRRGFTRTRRRRYTRQREEKMILALLM